VLFALNFRGHFDKAFQVLNRLLRANHTDVKVQQELLRHSNIATTMNVYTQAVSEQKRAAHGQVVEQLLSV
jgi:integrase